MTTSATYPVSGMTCGHCVSSVSQEISKIEGVRDVSVDLNSGGVSDVLVVSDQPLDEQAVRSAVDEAGYELAAAPR